MRHFTAIITPGDTHAPFEAVTLDLPLPVVTGRSFSEVQDNLLTAIQRHIDSACEGELGPGGGEAPRPDSALIARRVADLRRGQARLVEIPEYLFTRN